MKEAIISAAKKHDIVEKHCELLKNQLIKAGLTPEPLVDNPLEDKSDIGSKHVLEARLAAVEKSATELKAEKTNRKARVAPYVRFFYKLQ